MKIDINKEILTEYEKWLKNKELSNNTITCYKNALKSYRKNYDSITKNNLVNYKGYLVENFCGRTANLYITALLSFVNFYSQNNDDISFEKLKIKQVKFQKANFIENVISKRRISEFCRAFKKR